MFEKTLELYVLNESNRDQRLLIWKIITVLIKAQCKLLYTYKCLVYIDSIWNPQSVIDQGCFFSVHGGAVVTQIVISPVQC